MLRSPFYLGHRNEDLRLLCVPLVTDLKCYRNMSDARVWKGTVAVCLLARRWTGKDSRWIDSTHFIESPTASTRVLLPTYSSPFFPPLCSVHLRQSINLLSVHQVSCYQDSNAQHRRLRSSATLHTSHSTAVLSQRLYFY